MARQVHETDELSAQLHAFRATHIPKQQYVRDGCDVNGEDSEDGVNWEYFCGGDAKETLLLLPGVHGRGELAFQHILQFERTYRVISPNYPGCLMTVAQLVSGLVSLLQAEHVDTVYVLGGSYSGMVAQSLVRRYPELVKAVVLDHTSPPGLKQARRHTWYYLLLKLLPLSWLRALLKCGNKYMAPGVDAAGRAFWYAYFDDLITSLTKADYLSRIQVCIDFYRNYTFSRDDLRSWPGRILIIESDNDSYVPARGRAALKALYPQAQVYTFHETGHAAWANQFATFFSVIAQFLQEEN
jgi:pimeloyl-ACP methyl ester carboxylesterase